MVQVINFLLKLSGLKHLMNTLLLRKRGKTTEKLIGSGQIMGEQLPWTKLTSQNCCVNKSNKSELSKSTENVQ